MHPDNDLPARPQAAQIHPFHGGGDHGQVGAAGVREGAGKRTE